MIRVCALCHPPPRPPPLFFCCTLGKRARSPPSYLQTGHKSSNSAIAGGDGRPEKELLTPAKPHSSLSPTSSGLWLRPLPSRHRRTCVNSNLSCGPSQWINRGWEIIDWSLQTYSSRSLNLFSRKSTFELRWQNNRTVFTPGSKDSSTGVFTGRKAVITVPNLLFQWSELLKCTCLLLTPIFKLNLLELSWRTFNFCPYICAQPAVPSAYCCIGKTWLLMLLMNIICFTFLVVVDWKKSYLNSLLWGGIWIWINF